MDTIQQMKQHVSVRHYQDKEIPVEVKQDLLLAAQSARHQILYRHIQ